MKNRIKLKSVGAIVEGVFTYPMCKDGKADYENPIHTGDCIENNEWVESLSLKDRTKMYRYLNKVEQKETAFQVNDNLIICNFKFVDNKIHEFVKHGGLQPYKEFKGTIHGKKVKGYVCLNDDAIYGLEEVNKEFEKWAKSDNVVKVGDDLYKEQTTQWKKEFTRFQLKNFFIREFQDVK